MKERQVLTLPGVPMVLILLALMALCALVAIPFGRIARRRRCRPSWSARWWASAAWAFSSCSRTRPR